MHLILLSCKIGVLGNVPKGVHLWMLNHAIKVHLKLKRPSHGIGIMQGKDFARGLFNFQTFFMKAEVLILSSALFARGDVLIFTKGLDYKHNLGALLSKYMYSTLIIKVINRPVAN